MRLSEDSRVNPDAPRGSTKFRVMAGSQDRIVCKEAQCVASPKPCQYMPYQISWIAALAV